jgi:raffinose/stachyose/melibiose transport system substrate-binding protein
MAAALVIAGCSGAPTSGDGSNGFTFTYATSNNLESPYERLAKDYMDSHEGVTITLNPQPNDRYGETLRTQLQAGNASDVIQTAPGSGQPQAVIPLAEAGFLDPLDDAAASLIPTGNEPLFYQSDKLYGQPVDFTVTGLVFNSTAGDAAGVSTFPASTDALIADCRTLADKGKSFIALAGAAGPNTGLTAMSIAATRVYARDPDWNDKRAKGEVTFADSVGWRDTLETITRLKDAGCFQPGAEGGGFDAITNGLAQGTSLGAFIPSGAATEIAGAAQGQKLVVEPFPPAAGGKPFALASANYALSINAASGKKEAARAFLDWVAQPAQAKTFAEVSGALPVTGYQDLDLSDTLYAPVDDVLREGSFTALPNTIWPDPAVYEALSAGVQGLLTGQKTVNDVLTAMDAAWDRS